MRKKYSTKRFLKFRQKIFIEKISNDDKIKFENIIFNYFGTFSDLNFKSLSDARGGFYTFLRSNRVEFPNSFREIFIGKQSESRIVYPLTWEWIDERIELIMKNFNEKNCTNESVESIIAEIKINLSLCEKTIEKMKVNNDGGTKIINDLIEVSNFINEQ